MQLINDHELHFGKGIVGVYLIRIMHLKKLEKFLDSLKNEDFSHSTHGICILCQYFYHIENTSTLLKDNWFVVIPVYVQFTRSTSWLKISWDTRDKWIPFISIVSSEFEQPIKNAVNYIRTT